MYRRGTITALSSWSISPDPFMSLLGIVMKNENINIFEYIIQMHISEVLGSIATCPSAAMSVQSS